MTPLAVIRATPYLDIAPIVVNCHPTKTDLSGWNKILFTPPPAGDHGWNDISTNPVVVKRARLEGQPGTEKTHQTSILLSHGCTATVTTADMKPAETQAESAKLASLRPVDV